MERIENDYIHILKMGVEAPGLEGHGLFYIKVDMSVTGVGTSVQVKVAEGDVFHQSA